MEDSVSLVRRHADRGCHSCNLWFILIEISFPVQSCVFIWILNPWMLLIAYKLLIIYAIVGLTQLYSMLVLFSDCWEIKLLTQAGLEKLNEDLHQPSRIRYFSRSFSVRCFISIAYREGIDFYGFSIYCGTPQAIGSFLRNRISDHTGRFLVILLGDFFWHSMCLNCYDFSISEPGLGACFPSSVLQE